MKRLKREHLATLQSFSRSIRSLWSVLWVDHGVFDFNFRGYRSVFEALLKLLYLALRNISKKWTSRSVPGIS